jgi:hypothetical protein
MLCEIRGLQLRGIAPLVKPTALKRFIPRSRKPAGRGAVPSEARWIYLQGFVPPHVSLGVRGGRSRTLFITMRALDVVPGLDRRGPGGAVREHKPLQEGEVRIPIRPAAALGSVKPYATTAGEPLVAPALDPAIRSELASLGREPADQRPTGPRRKRDREMVADHQVARIKGE